MSERIDKPYRNTLAALSALFRDQKLEGVIIGGVAVSLLSVPRFTKDVNALILFDVRDIDSLIDGAGGLGFEPLFPGMAELARQTRVLALRYVPAGTRVDLLLGCLPFDEEVVARASTFVDGELSIRIATAEDLIILKAIAHRDQDLVDIRTIAEIQPVIDRERIRRWVRDYSDLLDTPELWSEIEPLLNSE